MMKKVLTIAGSDSGGGAGIQADLKTFSARGVYGMSAITALTAQNTMGVQEIFDIDPDFIGAQIDSVMEDIGADAWKTGMLSNKEVIRLLAEKAQEYEIEKLVIDPVMVAKSGDSLLKEDAQETLIAELIPLAYILTPNHHEAEVLTGEKIESVGDARSAAELIHEKGAQNVVIKGSRIPNTEDSIDILYDGKRHILFKSPLLKTENTHGTGCTFASAIAAETAKGNAPVNAIWIAKAYVFAALKCAMDIPIGNGHGPTIHSLNMIPQIELNSIKKTIDQG
ncbi:MAG: bifunctional hydroxymethylpyrimidine kinase/phosphomethylpyrimidine kinase [Promethearchaeia archaeon]